MKYSTGITNSSFWFLESKKTAEYILKNCSRQDIENLSINSNIYQAKTKNRAKTIAQTLYRRLEKLPKDLLDLLVKTEITTGKIIVLISILSTDKLFFEFMYEVFREKIILGELILKNKDFEIFFENKALKSTKIDKWSEKTIKQLKNQYISFLKESGILSSDKKIITPLIDFNLKNILIKNDFGPYLYAITGAK